MSSLLKVENLRVNYKTYGADVQAVRGVSFEVDRGETLAIVGESGCGKSVTAKSIMHLIHEPGKILEGSKIEFDGQNVITMSEKDLKNYRGGSASIIFQDAMASLNPTMTVGKQIMENIRHHQKVSKKEAKQKAIELLKEVGISEAEKRVDQYPHELSGGMRQRVMIAIAFANHPSLLIADEPTTSLDVTIQAQIMDLIRDLQKKENNAVILITHDLGVVADVASDIAVMYAGKIVERGDARTIFYKPRHPYTEALLQAVPRIDHDRKEKLTSIPGTPPDLIAPPKGCPFAGRCRFCMEICTKEEAPVYTFEEKHQASCWLYALKKAPADAPFAKGEWNE